MSALPSHPAFGDALARARQRWVHEMARRLENRGYQDYRRSDAWLMRWLMSGTKPIASLQTLLGTSRQASRKAVAGLVERGLAEVRVDEGDARRRNVVLTEHGTTYARDVLEVIDELNQAIRVLLDPESIRHAINVLETVAERFTP